MTVVTIYGGMNTKKSTILMTFPGPVFVFDLERGMHRALWRKETMEEELGRPICIDTWQVDTNLEDLLDTIQFTRGGAIHGRIRQWDEITTEFVKVIRTGKYKTIGFDTAKLLWDIDNQSILELRQIERPGKQTLDPLEYAAPNLRLQNILTICNQYEINLVLINHTRDIYAPRLIQGQMKEVATGEVELDGWRQTMDLSDWVLRTDCDVTLQSGQVLDLSAIQNSTNKAVQGEFQFKATIDKSPIGADLKGKVILDPSYQKLVSLAELFERPMV